MANYKQCSKCGKNKQTTEFYKKTSAPDGLQNYCRSCVKEINRVFREEKPEYQIQWQKENPTKHREIVKRYTRADKSGKIYYIKSPNGMFYIGCTQTHFNIRLNEHRAKWKASKIKSLKSSVPLLWESLNKWGWEEHEKGILLEFENIDRKTLRQYESVCIETFQKLGTSLNIKIK